MTDPQVSTQSRTFLIENSLGLHLRPASRLVQIFSEYPDCEVFVGTGETKVNGKSIMGLLMLEASQGTDLSVDVSGPGGEQILQRVGDLIAAKFDEE